MQQKRLKKIVSQSQQTNLQNFHSQAPKEYEDYKGDIKQIMSGNFTVLTKTAPLLLEPTGGSTSGTKLIPYTKALKKEFHHAIAPWLVELFFKYPSLLTGQQYWSITPASEINIDSEIPVGFESDTDYLSGLQKNINKNIFPVPGSLQKCRHFDSVAFVTLLFLMNTPHLRFFSFWHPSLLIIIIDILKKRFDELLNTLGTGQLPGDIEIEVKIKSNAKRVKQIRKHGCKPDSIWQNIKVISCWAGNDKKYWLDRIREIFPNAAIQPKGLIATEGITTIPLFKKQDVLAVCSHYYEFETDEGKILPFRGLEKGKTYHLILTTSGGFVRYKTHDLVKVIDYYHKVPCLEFISRNNYTSDICGEKISLQQAEKIRGSFPCIFSFAMIAPEKMANGFRYAVYIETNENINLEDFLESRLCENFHYRHARNTGQLQKAVMHHVVNPIEKINSYTVVNKKQIGTLKHAALSLEMHWNTIFELND